MSDTITLPLDRFIEVFVSWLDSKTYEVSHGSYRSMDAVERLMDEADIVEGICEELLDASGNWQPETILAMSAARKRLDAAYEEQRAFFEEDEE